MNDVLTIDEYAALSELLASPKGGRPSACVARNTKKLTGLKYLAHDKSGKLGLTDKGRQTLFVKNCVDGLRAVSTDPAVKLDAGVLIFLEKKGHVVRNAATGQLELTQRGRETLADIDQA
ncbi:hypothetical protein [Noviherbaspirillum sedimenti]|uniref:Uncharacterized protein n=1 Tax=Noviherbaspirillum sedimenti TaxID=2320865 RepID=A0A3A3G5U2_9BURK|nr:hypothetical protein [Noviherbaspirillum sedimenti]RJG03887.1 hypothetical protein D3878_21715 [Noviherbaspirillum sedimenti]